jgi:hypothetical protein
MKNRVAHDAISLDNVHDLVKCITPEDLAVEPSSCLPTMDHRGHTVGLVMESPLVYAWYRQSSACFEWILKQNAGTESCSNALTLMIFSPIMRTSLSMAHSIVEHGQCQQILSEYVKSPDIPPRVRYYFNVRTQRRAEQRAFLAAVLGRGSNNRDLARLFDGAIKTAHFL